MSNLYKLLVLDADGTLLDKKGLISDDDKKALAAVRAAGIRVALSTGRAVQACAKIFNQIKLDGYHIFFDGALVANPETGEEVYADPIDKDLVRQMAEYLHRIEINMDFYSASRYFVEKETWATEIRRTFFGLEPTIADFTKLWQRERIIKGTLIVASAEERARANDFYQHFKGNLKLSWTKTPAYPEVDFINVLAPDVSKGVALEALARFLKISLSEVMAMGDGSNDIPLLKTAGLAIAMANASAEVKAAASDIAPDVDHSGVSAAIHKYLL
ncbi:MAG TPA: Cof-type HAD-IIB family hydrolase [Dehalococcoidales bacterium]|nr:Cof-type HAD-IIB family hydrolase [Dehalococcoidales bacterium]